MIYQFFILIVLPYLHIFYIFYCNRLKFWTNHQRYNRLCQITRKKIMFDSLIRQNGSFSNDYFVTIIDWILGINWFWIDHFDLFFWDWSKDCKSAFFLMRTILWWFSYKTSLFSVKFIKFSNVSDEKTSAIAS